MKIITKTYGIREATYTVIRMNTYAYHPQSNGMIEMFPRTSICTAETHERTKWTISLPVILLGLHITIKSDIQASSVQRVYGRTLGLHLIFPQPMFTNHLRILHPFLSFVKR